MNKELPVRCTSRWICLLRQKTPIIFSLIHFKKRRTAAALAQSVERLTAERDVASSIPGAGLVLRVLK